MQGMRVRSLVWELRFYVPCDQKKSSFFFKLRKNEKAYQSNGHLFDKWLIVVSSEGNMQTFLAECDEIL